jgi:phospholipase C
MMNTCQETQKPLIEHVIVLMHENRSFDHMQGYLPQGGGLTGDEFNLVYPSNPASEKVHVNNQADYITPLGPDHDFVSVNMQLCWIFPSIPLLV